MAGGGRRCEPLPWGLLVTAAGGTRLMQPSVHGGSFRPCEESVKAAVHAERSRSLRTVLRSWPAAVLRASRLSRSRGYDDERSALEFRRITVSQPRPPASPHLPAPPPAGSGSTPPAPP